MSDDGYADRMAEYDEAQEAKRQQQLDNFAAAAMLVLLLTRSAVRTNEAIATEAYDVAAAMMVERGLRESGGKAC